MKIKSTPQFLLKVGDGRVLHYTAALAKRKDMVACLVDGTPLSMINTGIRLKAPVKAPTIEETVDDVEAVETEQTMPDDGTEPGEDLNAMKRTEIVALAKQRFGEEAEYLKANWTTEKLIEEFGKLEAMQDIKSEG